MRLDHILAAGVLLLQQAYGMDCDSNTDCVSCAGNTEGPGQDLIRREKGCAWHVHKQTCVEVNLRDRLMESDDTVMWEDMCPTPAPPVDSFLQNWMQHLVQKLPELSKYSLLDLSLPGTHDTLTYDLDLRVSDGGIDNHDKFAEILHKYDIAVPDAAEDYLRQQAQTQRLDITAQLDNGVRFLDLRMMYEYADEGNEGKKGREAADWYSLHLLESRKPMMTYLTEIRDWMVNHPTEIVVLWLSKHGSVCAKGESQYPNTPVDVKQAYWEQILGLFGDMTVDTRRTAINETSIQTMMQTNQRAVFYLTDYEEFSGNSQYALDACLIDNQLGPSVDDEVNAVKWEQDQFIGATLNKWRLKAKQGFLLMSMATGVPAEQMVASAALRFGSGKHARGTEKLTEVCADSFHIPGFKDWCPESLLDVANLENYYKQLTLYQAYSKMMSGWSFPNAIYLNGLDHGGKIRTGTRTLWGRDRGTATTEGEEHSVTGYAYVDTIIAGNVYQACNEVSHHSISKQCVELTNKMKGRIAAAPVSTWEDVQLGRLQNWPNIDRGAD